MSVKLVKHQVGQDQDHDQSGGTGENVEIEYSFANEQTKTNSHSVMGCQRQTIVIKILLGFAVLLLLLCVFVGTTIIVSYVTCGSPFGLIGGNCEDECVDLETGELQSVYVAPSELIADFPESVNLLPKLSECGHPYTSKLISQKRKKRLVGGKPVEKQCAFPWMAQVHVYDSENDRVAFSCGATLITKRYVLTSAHCVHCIHVGGVKVQSEKNVIEVEDIISHPNYTMNRPCDSLNDDSSFESKNKYKPYDVALIRLKEEVKSYNPVCLPFSQYYGVSRGKIYGNEKSRFTAGWGYTSNNSNEIVGKELKYLTLPIVSHITCKDGYYFNDTTITSNMICAGGKGKEICKGDSGGPLFVNVDGRSFQVGIAAFGKECTAGAPAVFINIKTFLPWILGSLEP